MLNVEAHSSSLLPSDPPATSLLDKLADVFAAPTRRYGIAMLRASLAIVFIWFGLLKLVGTSPAEDLIADTITWLPPRVFVPAVGIWETAIGLGLLFRPGLRTGLVLLFLHMPCTALPLLLRPDVCFTHWPFDLTLEGQYIIKNLVLVSAAIVIAGSAQPAAGGPPEPA